VPQLALQEGYCAESGTEDRDGEEETGAGCFDLYYGAYPKIRGKTHKKPKAGCLRGVSRKYFSALARNKMEDQPLR
jgi:hypothetical protein